MCSDAPFFEFISPSVQPMCPPIQSATPSHYAVKHWPRPLPSLPTHPFSALDNSLAASLAVHIVLQGRKPAVLIGAGGSIQTRGEQGARAKRSEMTASREILSSSAATASAPCSRMNAPCSIESPEGWGRAPVCLDQTRVRHQDEVGKADDAEGRSPGKRLRRCGC